MSKSKKIFLFIILTIGIVVSSAIVYCFAIVNDINLDDKKLVNLDNTITYLDKNGEVFAEESNNLTVTDGTDLPSHVKNAFIAIEDKRFYSHDGVDGKGLLRAFFSNFTSSSLKEGGSTISQQLIKNTHKACVSACLCVHAYIFPKK